ncbi:Rrf2 family transcriptional regulator [Massilia agilis]|uniref:Rrf2 family transcriptional regulator n=2 Tax=Massilia TaxID=149698 RepID=A0ABT2BPF9_9BURK|nr:MULTISPECIES: Rrf2 family transcriptional regulator [Massilia]MCS0610397.1 Rrf2 family transcriptional regulator [Massilia solisilvae]MCS0810703.1 Rrf2 family transcriptional regulator [Massilia agilis]
MRLTDYTDYALRVLMYVGAQKDRLVTIQEIAINHGISKNHLTKVVHRLGLAGLVETVRGRTGGVRLARDPETITIGSVVRLTEPDFTIVECFDEEKNTCALAPICVLKHALGRATSAYLQELDRISLASVLPLPRSRLADGFAELTFSG